MFKEDAMPAVTSRAVLKNRPVGRRSLAISTSSKRRCPRRKTARCSVGTVYLSLDPYMRGRISGVKSYGRASIPAS